MSTVSGKGTGFPLGVRLRSHSAWRSSLLHPRYCTGAAKFMPFYPTKRTSSCIKTSMEAASVSAMRCRVAIRALAALTVAWPDLDAASVSRWPWQVSRTPAELSVRFFRLHWNLAMRRFSSVVLDTL